MEDQTKYEPTPMAFPMCNELGHIMQEGATLRNYFAIKALQGMLAGRLINKVDGSGRADRPLLCEEAYDYADAMIKESSRVRS